MSDAVRIVVINDDPVALRLTERTLEEEGYEVAGFTSGAEAISRLSAGHEPDLVVADLHMPGIDGWKLCRLLRGPELPDFNDTPILVVSATFTGVDVESITRDLGANAFLPAPYHPETLKTYVRELLDGAHPQRPLEVLVVEDDEDLRRVVVRTFEEYGYRVHTAHDGASAREAARERRFDVHVLDFHLPDTDAGVLMHRLRRPDEAGVVLVITGDDDPQLPVHLLEAGADGYLRKPFDPRYLLDLTAKARRERSLLRVEALLERRTSELKESDSRMRALFRAIPDWVLVVDWQGRIVQANEQTFRELPEEVNPIGRPLADLLDPEVRSDTQDRLSAVWSSGRGSFETRLAAGELRRVVEVAAEVTELEGDPVLLMVARNITARRAAEAERRHMDARVQRAQRLESLGVLAGGVAHDFNNLLVGILGNASLALSEVDGGPGTHSLRQIEAAARRAAELTGQVLTFAGRSQAAAEPVRLGTLVEGLHELASPSIPDGVAWTLDVADDLPLVDGDPGQLQQAIMNLVLNAADAVEEGPGTIRVAVRATRLDAPPDPMRMTGAPLEPGDFVEVSVEDTGSGIPPEIRERVFEPFFTTKFAGRGLGLSTALGIVQTHDGAIAVDSVPDRGTTVRVLLPAVDPADDEGDPSDPDGARAAARLPGQGPGSGEGSSENREGGPGEVDTGEAGATDPSAGHGTGQGLKVLVVDDEPAVLRMVTAVLRRQGMTVFPAHDGESAVEVFLEAPESWDLVLVDYAMPGMNGRQLMDTIREAGSSVPLLLSSGYCDEQLAALAEDESGAVAVLPKPFRPSDLVARIHELIGSVVPGGVA